MVSDETLIFKPIKTNEDKIDAMVMHVVSTMNEMGYDGADQVAGYLLCGDPTYITSKNGCRVGIGKLDRFTMLEHIMRKYVDTVTKENTMNKMEEN